MTFESNPRAKSLVLASTSPYRRQLLERFRIVFESVDPGVDEEPFKAKGLAPEELVITLARMKAKAAGQLRPSALIVGGDQTVVFEGQALSKPGSVQGCMEQLSMLTGRKHDLLTAVCVFDSDSGQIRSFLDVHTMVMRPLTEAQIRRYVQLDQPLDCAGSYKIESLGIALFERVSGMDPTSIVGLPLMKLAILLDELGYDLLS